MTSLKIRNNLQIHILHLLECEPSVELFTVLAEAWQYDSLKMIVKIAYLKAHIYNCNKEVSR